MSTASFIRMTCGCGKSVKAPATAVGRKARCPACSAIVVITDAGGVTSAALATAPDRGAAASRTVPMATRMAPPAAPPRLPPVVTPASPFDDMDALETPARQAEAAPPAPPAARCPQCSTRLPDGAVLCTQCGYDTRTGKKLKTASTRVSPQPQPFAAGNVKRKAPADYMAPQGSIVLGLMISAALAVAASLVWIVIACVTGITIGWLGILIGFAAGMGMQIGHKGYSQLGGVAAATITLVTIFLAKLVVLEVSLAATHQSMGSLGDVKLGFYFFSPIGLLIIAISVGAAYRTANGSSRD